MRKTTILLFTITILILSASAYAQKSETIEATTKDGRAVILKADGTWEFVKKEPVKVLGVTAVGFAALKTGMSYAEVVEILGRKGEVLSESSIAEIHTVMFGWKADKGGLGANMNVLFQNDKLVSKAQAGLK